MVTHEDGRSGEVSAGGETSGGSRSPVLALLAVAVVASGTLLLVLGSRLTFLLDDWEFLVYRRDFDADAILSPHGEHIVVVPMLIYKALLGTFGMDSAFPFRVVSVSLFLLSAVLLFVFLRRRVGDWTALAATTVVLFLGAASEDLLWSFQMGYFGGMSAGLAALLMLERGDRRGDVWATVFLAVAVLFSSLGIPFAIGAAVEILRRGDRLRRLYIVAVPAAIYAAWWLGWGHDAESALSLSTLAQTPAFVLNSVSAAFASLTGLALPSASDSPGGLDWGRIVFVVVLALGGWWLHRLGRLPRWFWVVLAVGGSFWILAGLNQAPGREPTASRYQYVGVIFVMLIAAEVFRGSRPRGRALWVVMGLAVVAILPNLHMLHGSYENYRGISHLEKAALGSLDIARGTVEPGFILSEDLADTAFVHIEAGAYFAAEEKFGTPAYSPEELAEAAAPARFAADKVLSGALEVGLAELPGGDFPDLVPQPGSANSAAIDAVPADGCLTVGPLPESPQLALPRGGVILRAGGQPIENVKLARYSEGEFPIEFPQGLGAGDVAEIEIPPDAASAPWQMRLESGAAATVCGLAASAR